MEAITINGRPAKITTFDPIELVKPEYRSNPNQDNSSTVKVIRPNGEVEYLRTH